MSRIFVEVVIKLPRLQPWETVYLLIEGVACGQRDSIIHASVDRVQM